MGIPTIPKTGDTAASLGLTDFWIYQTFADTLVVIGADGNPAGKLAESWKPLDATTWQFKLKPNISFQNGEPLDAAAVKFTMDRVIDPANKLTIGTRFGTVAKTDVVDSQTVNITTKAQDVLLPKRMVQLYIQPPKYFAQAGGSAFNTKPIGTGPFQVVNWAPGKVTVTPAKSSWRGSPKLSQVVFVEIPDPSTRAAAVRSDQIQVAFGLDPTLVKQIEAGGVNIIPNVISQVESLRFVTTADTPIKNKLVRQAIDFALDKEALASAGSGGLSKAAPGQLATEGVFGYNPNITGRPYDPQKAKQLLTQAGFPNGFSIPMSYVTSGAFNTGELLMAQAIPGYLSKVGIQVQQDAKEYAVHLDMFLHGKLDPLNVGALGTTPVLDADVSLQWLLSNSVTKFYANPEFDSVIKASREEADPAKRVKLLQQASQIVYDDAAIVPIFNSAAPIGTSKKVQGFKTSLDGMTNFEGVTIA